MSDTSKLLEALEAAGYTLHTTKKGRVRVMTGEGTFVAVFSPTTKDWRAIKNFRATLKRHGFTS